MWKKYTVKKERKEVNKDGRKNVQVRKEESKRKTRKEGR